MRQCHARAALFLTLLFPVGPALGQGPANPDFEQGEPGEAPSGWYFAARTGGTVALDDAAPFEGRLSAHIDASTATGNRFSNLMQTLDATPWRGQRVRYRAAIRTANLTTGSAAQLWFRVDRPDDAEGNRQPGAFDNMDDRPIRAAEWAHHEIVLDVAEDAERIALGMFVTGNGSAWLDDVTMATVAADVATTAVDRPQMDSRLSRALAQADKAPRQPFWTAWLVLPALAFLLFVVGMWPSRRSPDPAAPLPRSGLVRWFALRFTIAYWLLYCLPGPFAQLVANVPGVGPQWSAELGAWHTALEASSTGWTARHVFGIEGELVPPNGSGDTTHNYVAGFACLVLALAIAALWTLAARHRPSRDASVDLLRSYLRYVLAFAMLGYGLAKVSMHHNQFPVVDGWRLGRTWGETSPMGVVWAFMGASRPYTVFGGLAEVLGAVLLIWRRTALLGALVSIGVMTNIVMLNYCYDVPVKLYSTHLWLMGILIAVPDVRRLAALLLRNSNPDDPGTPSVWRGKPWARWPLKLVVLISGVAIPLWHRSVEVYENVTTPNETAGAAAEADDHLLTSRGFRWINEVPFNR